MAERPATVALLGGGVIGGGWAARFVLNGIDVRVYDPDPAARRRVEEMVVGARRAYRRLTLAPLPPEGTVAYLDSIADAVEDAELVQESAPERVALKQELLAAASAVAPPDTPFCSSTSGLRPSLLAARMRLPERFIVAHPFNPVYLLPLVELCAGERTAPETVTRVAAIYRAVGMEPVTVRHEIDGFIADRLLEALWREALWLVHDGVATVEEVDDAIRYGAGLRWAFMGTFLTYRMAGGPGGMRHFLEQFGPALDAPWTKLVDVPELTAEFREELAAQSDAQARGRSLTELERARDDCLVALLQALRAQRAGAGEALMRWERALMERADDGTVPRLSSARSPALPAIVREVPADWIDYNGHVTESRYLELFSQATDALLAGVGVDAAYLDGGHSYFTVESHICHLGELHAGDRVEVCTQVLGFDDKRLHLFHALARDGAQQPAATAEQMLVHVDTTAGRAAPAAAEVRDRVAALAAAHAGLPPPAAAGRAISTPAPPDATRRPPSPAGSGR